MNKFGEQTFDLLCTILSKESASHARLYHEIIRIEDAVLTIFFIIDERFAMIQ